MVFLPNLSVNLRACLCGVVNYASAQALDFLDLGQKSLFLDWKHQKVPFFGNGLLWTGTKWKTKGISHPVYAIIPMASSRLNKKASFAVDANV